MTTNPDTNVFERFNINTGHIHPDTIQAMHEAYHKILASINSTKEDSGDIVTRRNKVKSEWLSDVDLPKEVHDAIDELEEETLAFAFEEDVRLLAPLYARLLNLTSEVKKQLDDQINRVANPNSSSRRALGTKSEMKLLRDTAGHLSGVYTVLHSTTPSAFPEPLSDLEWVKIPPGRDISLPTETYVPGKVRYRIPSISQTWFTKTEMLDHISTRTNKRLTVNDFNDWRDENSLSTHGDWTATYFDVGVTQKRFTE